MTRYISVTDTAKLIRTDLKREFPNVKFSVRSKSYSGGASITIDYTGNVTQKKIESVVNKYQGASFDGMIDLKSSITGELNGEKVHFGSDYIFVHRLFTITEICLFAEYFAMTHNFEDVKTGVTTKPEFEVRMSEYSGGYIHNKNDVMFGGYYFDQYVMKHMRDYDTFEEFLKEYDIEEYNKRYNQVIEVEQENISSGDNNDITVELDKNWTWIYGVKRDNKELQGKLKEIGFRWSFKREAWYYGFDAVKQIKQIIENGE